MNRRRFTPASIDAFRSSSCWTISRPSQKALKISIDAFPSPISPITEKGRLSHGKQSSKIPHVKVAVAPLDMDARTVEVMIRSC